MQRLSLIGRTVGNYQILRELGRGGMGVVYLAKDRVLQRRVAVKVLPEHLAEDAVFVKRFLREARAAARLTHPNLVIIHAVGQHEGSYFIEMELVRGWTLAEIIETQGRFGIRHALNITRQAAEALAAAHENGIIHRDIKPQNIAVNAAGRVKVMDFGLAKAVKATTQLTSDGLMLGTPLYMSPEQCQGSAVDARSDIYSLGVTLFEMLAGRSAYDATTPPLSLMYQIVHEPFPNVRDVIADVPAGTAAIVAKMTAKNAEERYASAEEVARECAAELEKVLRSSAGVGQREANLFEKPSGLLKRMLRRKKAIEEFPQASEESQSIHSSEPEDARSQLLHAEVETSPSTEPRSEEKVPSEATAPGMDPPLQDVHVTTTDNVSHASGEEAYQEQGEEEEKQIQGEPEPREEEAPSLVSDNTEKQTTGIRGSFRNPRLVAVALCFLTVVACVAVWALIGAFSGPESIASPMLGGNAQHTGYSDVSGPLTEPEILWETPMEGRDTKIGCQPVVDESGNLFAVMGANRVGWNWAGERLIALRPDGIERWRYEIANPVEQPSLIVPALLPNGLVVAGFRDWHLRAFSQDTGELRWERPRIYAVSCPVVDDRGYIYAVMASDEGLSKLDPETGDAIWTLGALRGHGLSPALSRDERTLYVGGGQDYGELFAVDTAAGSIKWRQSPQSEGRSFKWCVPTVGPDGTIYHQCAKSGDLYAFVDEGGAAREKWRLSLDRPGDAPRRCAVDEDSIYVGTTDPDPLLMAVSPEKEERWRHVFPGAAGVGSPLVTRDAVYTVVAEPEDGALVALDKHDGTELWRKQTAPDGVYALGGPEILYFAANSPSSHPDEAVIMALGSESQDVTAAPDEGGESSVSEQQPLTITADEFPLGVGCEWVYKTDRGFDMVVDIPKTVEHNGETFYQLRFTAESGLSSQYFVRRSDGVYLYYSEDDDLPSVPFKFPMKVGVQMEQRVYTSTTARDKGMPGWQRWQAEREEMLDLPMGKVRAIRYLLGEGDDDFADFWIAPGVGIVKFTSDIDGPMTCELASFTQP
ncbi:MAG: serine/threonine-protein kinase [Candidatus Hydrogenedentota bacterium]